MNQQVASDNKSEQLYLEVILRHHRNPFGFGELPGSTHSAEGYNHVCGDHIHIFAKVSPAGEVINVTFTAEACAVCRASASLMCGLLRESSKERACQLLKGWIDGLESNPETISEHIYGEAAVLKNLKDFPARVKCARLPWQTFLSALEGRACSQTEPAESVTK